MLLVLVMMMMLVLMVLMMCYRETGLLCFSDLLESPWLGAIIDSLGAQVSRMMFEMMMVMVISDFN